MASLAATLLLVPLAAEAGSYTAVTTGGTTPSTVTPAYTATSSSPTDAVASTASRTGSPAATYTIQVSPGTFTTTFTWTHDNAQQDNTTDPPPTCVLVEQDSSATWYVRNENGTGTGSGEPDCGLSGGMVTTSTYNAPNPSLALSAMLCSQQSGSSFSASCSPTASFTGTTGSSGLVSGEATVSGGARAYPITINLGGTQPVSGTQYGLTGRQITATLSGIPTNYTVTKYTWSGQSATCFKTYNEQATSNQLTPLGSGDFSGPPAGSTPAAGSNTVPSFAFYDSAADSLTLTCTATVLAPDGKSTVNLTATAPAITVEKPTATWGITTGNVQHSTANSTAAGDAYGLYPAFGSNAPGGVYWHDVVVTVPPPFSGGTCCFTQLVQPNHQYNGIGIGTNNNVKGLDNSFQYFNYTWAPGSKGTENDSPAVLAGPGKKVGDVDTANDSFQAWIMYQPTGGVWVPLQMYSYSWAVTLTWVDPGVAWSVSGQNPAPPNPGPAATPNDAKDPPQWSVVQINNE